MFTSKQPALITTSAKKASAAPTSKNAFVNASLKKAAIVRSENGAMKYSTTGNPFVDQFGQTGSYKAPRTFAQISTDMSTLWAINPLMTVCFTLFLRTITRIVSLFDGTKTETTQRGSGLRHESIMRMMWLHIFHADVFWKNIVLFISVGSWKDIIQMLSLDLQYNGWKDKKLDWQKFAGLLMAGLENPNTSELIKKYLPQLRSNNKTTTLEAQADNMIAKWICSLLFGTKEGKEAGAYKQYRQFKSAGTAHQWQQLISKKLYDQLDFNTIHGRALTLLVSGKFIKNQNLTEVYTKWIESKPIAKFTGYVHELFAKIPTDKYKIDTINSQFAGAVEKAKNGAAIGTSMIVVRDTSASMNGIATGTKMSCGDIAKALALFFSEMLPTGAFSNAWIEFNASAQMRTWKGSTPVEKWNNDHASYVGNTNFQSVINLFATMKRSGIDESEFPTGIICISDGEFDQSQLNQTNVVTALDTLRRAGFSTQYCNDFKIVLWNLQRGYSGNKFETYGKVPNVYYFAGYEPSVIAFLTGVEGQKADPSNAEELFNAAMDQQVLNMVEI